MPCPFLCMRAARKNLLQRSLVFPARTHKKSRCNPLPRGVFGQAWFVPAERERPCPMRKASATFPIPTSSPCGTVGSAAQGILRRKNAWFRILCIHTNRVHISNRPFVGHTPRELPRIPRATSHIDAYLVQSALLVYHRFPRIASTCRNFLWRSFTNFHL